ncbi:hypothetical protein B0H14DRAFT_2625598 [Mycena olivaceomarginata]|nr:hypothetical protein B0H14DRAFT_2625598 [Mycena olivaceomarginata]
MTFDDATSGSWFPNPTVIPATLTAPSFRHGLSQNSTMKQQVNSTHTYTTVLKEGSSGLGYIMVLVCGGSTEPYKLILVGRDLYDWVQTMVCSPTPKITNVTVDYSYGLFSDTINATSLPGGVPDFGGAAGLSAVTMIATMVSFSQSASGSNPVGDQLECVLRNVYGTDFGNNSIKLATVFRACLSARNVAPFVQGVPENMTIPSTGTLHTEFLGWEFTKSTSWVLIPGALIAIATIYAVHKSLTHHKENPEGEEFDPADTLDLVSASAAGGVSGVFIGTREDRRKAAEDINIVWVPSQGRE